MLKHHLANILKVTLEELGVENPEIELTHPTSLQHGDFSSNFAFKYAKQFSLPPFEFAEKVKEKIARDDAIERIEVLKPGFLNIFLSRKTLLSEILNTNDESSTEKDKKVVVLEFGQPNTHKTPHIGHLFAYIYGESLARLYEKSGYEVKRLNYQGDIGPHVAKCLWAVEKHKDEIKSLVILQQQVHFLQKCYQEGSDAYEKSKHSKEEIDKINDQLYRRDSSIIDLWQKTRQWSVDFYKAFEKSLGITFDKYYFESEISDKGKDLVNKHLGKIFEKSENAIVFEGEKYGLHTRVFVNSQGNPTYEAKDLGLIAAKLNDFKFDLSLVTTAAEQNEYWKVIGKASVLLFPQLENKYKHLGFGMINLITGKMSSRTGQIINAVTLIEEVKSRVKSAFSMKDDVLVQIIALAAVKYSFLKSDAFKNISFDMERSIAKDGDSGPYLLYTFVRTQSILKQSKEKKDVQIEVPSTLENEEEVLLRKLYLFPEFIEKALEYNSPHFIATFLFDLAQSYNIFYQKHPVLKSEGEVRQFRLLLTESVGKILKQGLYLLGIETVDKM
ncbi:MAG: arginine--tRNA ligase [Patescibacteria group bacterium]